MVFPRGENSSKSGLAFVGGPPEILDVHTRNPRTSREGERPTCPPFRGSPERIEFVTQLAQHLLTMELHPSASAHAFGMPIESP